MSSNTAYENWKHSQLEPDNILRTGNYKRHGEVKRFIAAGRSYDFITEQEEKRQAEINAENDRRNDEYLKQHGI